MNKIREMQHSCALGSQRNVKICSGTLHGIGFDVTLLLHDARQLRWNRKARVADAEELSAYP